MTLITKEKIMTNTTKEKNSKLGIIHILIAAFGFSLMTLFLKLAGDLPTMEKAFFRNIVALFLSVIMLSRSKEKFHIKKQSYPSLFFRSFFGTAGLIANFWAIDRLGLADANMLNKMSPFFAMLMSIFILKEIPDKVEWISIIVAFIGAILIVKPSAGIASLPAFVGLFGGFGAGTAYSFVRKVTRNGERGPVVVMCFSLFSSLVTLPFMIIYWVPMSLKQFLFLLLSGTFAMVGQLNITAAYSYAPAAEISVYDYSQVLFAAILGFFFFGELPDLLSFLGYGIIIGIAIIKWYYTLKIKAKS